MENKPVKVIPNAIQSLRLSGKKEELLTLITNLDIKSRKLGIAGCNARNIKLAEKVELVETTVSKYIREFRAKGYVTAGAFHGHYRILNSKFHDAVLLERKTYYETLNQKEKEQRAPRTDGLGGPDKEYGAGEYESTGPNLTNIGTNQNTNKESKILFAKEFLPTLLEKAKSLILKEWGKYECTSESEKVKAKLWFKINSNPEFAIEVIRKLIIIKNSDEFKNDLRYWGTIPINIAYAYSHKDSINTTYDALVRSRSSKSNTNENNSTSVGNKTIDKKKELLEATWKNLSLWGKERLTLSTMEILNSVTVKDEGNEIHLFGEIPLAVKRVIEKFFAEEVKEKKIVKYFETEESNNKENENRFNDRVRSKKDTFVEEKHENEKSEEDSIFKIDSNTEFKNFRDFTDHDKDIREFIKYAEFKINQREHLDALRNVKIQYDYKQIVICEKLPNEVKNIIREYFYEKKMPIAVFFLEDFLQTSSLSENLKAERFEAA
ncbi:DNA-binding protein [Leptospira kmetyi]|uniref:DNA-binding protein n=1 Tax=Leptospira kmetyi TaxID=408139 RepID=A0ABX4N3J8_9LEPT|nr:DNA-binding protein [Leptospira kmetyi]PJZ27879.1 hypothetical protein CH378_20810 [Leptospira kmetyi]PJZ39698.1 hypothetical protein CH370_19790 [Leptospira kmetyi]